MTAVYTSSDLRLDMVHEFARAVNLVQVIRNGYRFLYSVCHRIQLKYVQ